MNFIAVCGVNTTVQSVGYSKAHSFNYHFLSKSEFQCPKKPPKSATYLPLTTLKKKCCKICVRERTRYHQQSRSDMRKQYNSVLSCWAMVCCNCVGLEWCQFFLDFWYFAWLTTRCYLGLLMEKLGAFEDKKGRSTLPNLCASKKLFSPCSVGIYLFPWE